MPRPSSVQAPYHQSSEGVTASSARPAACTRLPQASTTRPPVRSTQRPTCGEQSPLIRSDQEKAPSTAVRETPRLAATGPFTMAGR